MTLQEPLPVFAPLEGDTARREGFALFRQAMLGIPDIGGADREAEARYLFGGDLIGAHVGETLHAVANGYASEITLPGGARLPHLSVTHVGTQAQSSRRGLARGLLTFQLHRARAAGYPLAGLRASDTRIYGRFGYGTASYSVRHDLDLTKTSLRTPAPAVPVRAVDPVRDLALLRRITEGAPSPRPATLQRWDGWWSIQEFRLTRGAGPFHALVAGKPGAETGALRFHAEVEGNWFTSGHRRVVVDDLIAHDDETWRALIAHLFALDIVHEVVFASRPVDDPLPLLLDNPRALQISGRRDESWVRILDVDAVLAHLPARRGAPVLIGVSDPLFAQNNATWRFDESGVTRVGVPADITFNIAELSSWVFGADSAEDLFATGRISGTTSAAVALDSLLPKTRAPHSGISF